MYIIQLCVKLYKVVYLYFIGIFYKCGSSNVCCTSKNRQLAWAHTSLETQCTLTCSLNSRWIARNQHGFGYKIMETCWQVRFGEDSWFGNHEILWIALVKCLKREGYEQSDHYQSQYIWSIYKRCLYVIRIALQLSQ